MVRVGQAETVDGLLDVPYHEEVLPAAGESGEDGVLDGVGVLILVHHHLVVPLPPPPGQFGGGAVSAAQQAGGHVLQVGEIQQPPAAFFGGVGVLKVPHQGEEPPDGGTDRPHVLQKPGAVVQKQLPQLPHPLLALLPEGLDPLPGPAGSPQPRGAAPERRKLHSGAGGRLVPAPLRRGGQLPQAVQSDLQTGAVGFGQLFLLLGQIQGFLHPSRPVIGLTADVGQQQPSPWGVPGVGHPRHGKGPLLLIQPRFGVRVALDPPPDVQHDLHEAAVVPVRRTWYPPAGQNRSPARWSHSGDPERR